jgi:hypothetical protein
MTWRAVYTPIVARCLIGTMGDGGGKGIGSCLIGEDE